MLDTPPQPSPIARAQGSGRAPKGKVPRRLGQSLEGAQEAAQQQKNDSDDEHLAPENLTQTGKERERQKREDPKFQNNHIGDFSSMDLAMEAMAKTGHKEGNMTFTRSGVLAMLHVHAHHRSVTSVL